MKLELLSPTGHLQPLLQRAVDLVAFGLTAASDTAPQHLTIPGVPARIVTAGVARTVEDARDEFRLWIIANGLRECVEGIGDTLEWVRRACFLWSRCGQAANNEVGTFSLQASISGEEWNEHVVKGAVRFNRLPLPDKFSHLGKTFNWRPPGLVDEVLSLNAARNCLVHRAGVVGHQDLRSDADSGLAILWCTPHVAVGRAAEECTMDLASLVEAGETMSVSLRRVERLVPLGEKLLLTATDFMEIAMTIVLFSLELERSVFDMQERRRPRAD